MLQMAETRTGNLLGCEAEEVIDGYLELPSQWRENVELQCKPLIARLLLIIVVPICRDSCKGKPRA